MTTSDYYVYSHYKTHHPRVLLSLSAAEKLARDKAGDADALNPNPYQSTTFFDNVRKSSTQLKLGSNKARKIIDKSMVLSSRVSI